jgi:ribulose-5-phosphate 4-epimerase/fuculose-1-phosphate aldolase
VETSGILDIPSMKDKVGYHTYEGLVHGGDNNECDRLTGDLGDKTVLIMRNHGTLVVGRSIGEAFLLNHYLERASAIQMQALTSGQTIVEPTDEVCAEIAGGWIENRANPGIAGSRDWAAVRRQMDRLDPSYLT